MFLFNLNLLISIICLMVIILERKYGVVKDPFESLNEAQSIIDDYRENGQEKMANFCENLVNSMLLSSMRFKLLFVVVMSLFPIFNIAITISTLKDLLQSKV